MTQAQCFLAEYKVSWQGEGGFVEITYSYLSPKPSTIYQEICNEHDRRVIYIFPDGSKLEEYQNYATGDMHCGLVVPPLPEEELPF